MHARSFRIVVLFPLGSNTDTHSLSTGELGQTDRLRGSTPIRVPGHHRSRCPEIFSQGAAGDFVLHFHPSISEFFVVLCCERQDLLSRRSV